jgi:hypothetical protein
MTGPDGRSANAANKTTIPPARVVAATVLSRATGPRASRRADSRKGSARLHIFRLREVCACASVATDFRLVGQGANVIVA